MVPTPVLMPGKSQGQRRLAGNSPWGQKRAGHYLATRPQQQWSMCSIIPPEIRNVFNSRNSRAERHNNWDVQEHNRWILEKAMATHSSTLARKIPWTEEPDRLQSTGSQKLSNFTSTHWRRKWQPTPMFLPGESQGWQSLVGCHLWGRTESDVTEVT